MINRLEFKDIIQFCNKNDGYIRYLDYIIIKKSL